MSAIKTVTKRENNPDQIIRNGWKRLRVASFLEIIDLKVELENNNLIKIRSDENNWFVKLPGQENNRKML